MSSLIVKNVCGFPPNTLCTGHRSATRNRSKRCASLMLCEEEEVEEEGELEV